MALGSSASANVLERGGTVRLAREAPFREWHLYGVLVTSVGGGDVLLRSTSPAVVGKRYSVLDERGFRGEAVVSSVERIVSQNPGCAEIYYEARAFLDAGPRAVQGDLLAVGPAPVALVSARVIPPRPFRQRIPPLADGKHLGYVVDLDGAGDPELFMVDFECDGERVARPGTGPERCLELWSREGKRWSVVARARSPICK